MRGMTSLVLLLAVADCASPVEPGQESRATQDSAEGTAANRGFLCDPTAVDQELVVARVAGGSGAVTIRSAGTCTFDLLVREEGAARLLSTEPGGYLLAAAASTGGPRGDALVCASNAHHEADPMAPTDSQGDLHRRVTRVPIECAARHEGRWNALSPIVPAGGDWAAWMVAVLPAPERHRFRVRWIHDATFQFLNVTDAGRPVQDGLYETTIDVRSIAAGSTRKLSDSVLPTLQLLDPFSSH